MAKSFTEYLIQFTELIFELAAAAGREFGQIINTPNGLIIFQVSYFSSVYLGNIRWTEVELSPV